MGNTARKLNNMVSDTYKVQIRVQVKAQANVPTVVNAPPVAQKAAPKIVKLPIKSEKRILKHCSVEWSNSPHRAL